MVVLIQSQPRPPLFERVLSSQWGTQPVSRLDDTTAVSHVRGRAREVMSGVETAPAALEGDATQLQRTQYTKETRRFEKNGKLFTRMILPTADCREGYASVAAQVVQAYAVPTAA